MKLKKYKIPLTSPVHKYKFTFNEGILGQFKSMLLRYQIDNHMKHTRRVDKALHKSPHQFAGLPEAHIISMARQRGISLEDAPAIKEYLRKCYIPLSVDMNLKNDFLIWIQLARYPYCEIIA